MQSLYPLRFRPILRQYIWGGRRLESILGKQLGAGDDYAESWEICDHGQDQTCVADGPLAGTSLGELVSQRGEDLLGRHHPQRQFPLLLKFLDAQRTLSVQVHPNDAQGAQLDPPDLGKTEAWVILHAEPDSLVYSGLKPGVDRQTFERQLRHGETEAGLYQFHPAVGDCLFIPAGTVHALGAGLVVAEIQQASDTTFRLFDWNRVGTDGKPRQLHIEQALPVIDFERGPVHAAQPQPTEREFVERLVQCDKFVLDRWKFSEAAELGGDQRCHILAVLEGEVHVTGDPAERPLTKGETMLVPAACGAVTLTPRGDAVLLDAYLP